MATYKVIQDIEAEDKLLGPLTLRRLVNSNLLTFDNYFIRLCLCLLSAFLWMTS